MKTKSELIHSTVHYALQTERACMKKLCGSQTLQEMGSFPTVHSFMKNLTGFYGWSCWVWETITLSEHEIPGNHTKGSSCHSNQLFHNSRVLKTPHLVGIRQQSR